MLFLSLAIIYTVFPTNGLKWVKRDERLHNCSNWDRDHMLLATACALWLLSNWRAMGIRELSLNSLWAALKIRQ
jgi:hypothetical protein